MFYCVLWFGASHFWESVYIYLHVLPKQENNLLTIINFFFIFSVTNLKYWGRCEPVISRTLQFLNDLSVGYPFYYKSTNIRKEPDK